MELISISRPMLTAHTNKKRGREVKNAGIAYDEDDVLAIFHRGKALEHSYWQYLETMVIVANIKTVELNLFAFITCSFSKNIMFPTLILPNFSIIIKYIISTQLFGSTNTSRSLKFEAIAYTPIENQIVMTLVGTLLYKQ